MTKANYKFVRLVARFSFCLLRFKSLDLISECIMCCLRGYSLVSCTDILGASHELRRINYKALKVLYIQRRRLETTTTTLKIYKRIKSIAE